MKSIICLAAALILVPLPASAQRLQLQSLDRLAERAEETVNIDLDAGMLGMASSFMGGQGDQAQIKQLLSELEGIYVRVFEFNRAQSYASEFEAVRKQLTGGSWARLISVKDNNGEESVDVYSWRNGNVSGGLAILVAEPDELVVVNIVGPMDLAKLAALQGQFGIPRLPRELGGGQPTPQRPRPVPQPPQPPQPQQQQQPQAQPQPQF